MMNGADSNDVFVVDASAVGDLRIADLIVDFAPQAETVDLTGLVSSLLERAGNTPNVDAAAVVAPEAGIEAAQPVGTVAEGFLDLAGLSGIGHTITILYDETPAI